MKNKWILMVVTLLLVSGILLGNTQTAAADFSSTSGISGYGNGNGSGIRGTGTSSTCTGVCTNDPLSLSTVPLSTTETASLLYMVEEEKLARDVYQFLATKWSLPVFANIAKSEQVHMDSVLVLINRYGLPSPVSSQAGVFTNNDLQALYTQLTAKGSQSLADALLVGGAIEEIDIRDLQSRLSSITHTDLTQVFNNLLLGSYNHLQAFTAAYKTETGSVYTAQYLDAAAFKSALTNTSVAGNGSSTGTTGRGFSGRH